MWLCECGWVAQVTTGKTERRKRATETGGRSAWGSGDGISLSHSRAAEERCGESEVRERKCALLDAAVGGVLWVQQTGSHGARAGVICQITCGCETWAGQSG